MGARSLTCVLLLLCAMLLGACSMPSTPVVVRPVPSAALLEPCVDPAVVADPDKATDNDFAMMMLNLGKAYEDCKRRQADLATFVRGGK